MRRPLPAATTHERNPQAFASWRDFHPYCLSEHRSGSCRRLRFVGSTPALPCPGPPPATGNPWRLRAGRVCGHGCAWIGVCSFEKNRPATFRFPRDGFVGDRVMYADLWRDRIPR